MDNASIHKGDAVKDALAKIGLTATYLSPYSPVFNPCELIFGKVKRTIRADERVAEDSDQLRDFVMDGLARVSPSDIEGFYRHCGLRT
jgi:transposase